MIGVCIANIVNVCKLFITFFLVASTNRARARITCGISKVTQQLGVFQFIRKFYRSSLFRHDKVPNGFKCFSSFRFSTNAKKHRILHFSHSKSIKCLVRKHVEPISQHWFDINVFSFHIHTVVQFNWICIGVDIWTRNVS